jgi:hypothetical protein
MLRDELRRRSWRLEQQCLQERRLTDIRTAMETRSDRDVAAQFEYEAAIDFLSRQGCDPFQVREGSVPETSLRYCAEHLRSLDTSRALLGLHVGNFVGVSLAWFAYTARQPNADSVVVSIDANTPHRGFHNPLRRVLELLSFFGLQGHVLVLTGYSLEECLANDGMPLGGSDPLQSFRSEVSCENQLLVLAAIAPESSDSCMIDGNHEADYLRREIQCIDRLLKAGGRLFLDDISWQWPELLRVYQSLNESQYRRVGTDGRVGVVEKHPGPIHVSG